MVICHIVSFIGHLRSGCLEVTFCSLVVNFHLGGHVCFGSVALDLRKIPQVVICHIDVLSGLF